MAACGDSTSHGTPNVAGGPGRTAGPSSTVVLGFDLAARTVLVVGGGRVAEARVEALAGSGARIIVVAPELTSRLGELAVTGRLRWRARRFRPFDAQGCALVIAAASEPAVNHRVRRWAHRFRALVNVVDDPAHCDVIFPAVVHRGPVRVAVTTDGVCPAAARFLREELDRLLPGGLGDLVAAAGAARGELRRDSRYRYDYAAWRQQFLEPGWEAATQGRIGAIEELRARFVTTLTTSTPLRAGRITLVGAGPGHPDLLTLGGAAALSTADVVVYDRLVDPALLDLAPVAAERIPMGKAKGSGTDQADINRLLIERASTGAHVVRLKGGDPFLFGRGGEEVDAVRAAGLEIDVIPGISSALAAPALAGIPVTHRGESAAVTILTGHRADEGDHDWPAIARTAETIVLLMAASTAPAVARHLLDAGRPSNQPVAAIHRAATDASRTTLLTLGELAARDCPFPSPTVVVIGRVAARAAAHHGNDAEVTPAPRRCASADTLKR